MYSARVVRDVLNLVATGLSDYEIARRTGISRSTILNWRHGRLPGPRSPASAPCPLCYDPARFETERGSEYAYLLGQYLGDGCVFPNRTSYALRISSDAKYVEIIDECEAAIVEAHPRHFLRGLIHSDGWPGLNRVTVKGRDYAYPRYQFSNRSADIRTLFTYACELVGVEWRPWGRWHISVARRESVARLDEFIGEKR